MNTTQIIQELQFKAVRSSGAGGQHVNKVSTKIELTYDLQNSTAVTDKEKERLLLKLSNRLTKENVLLLQCDDSRSQHKNKDLAIKRFLELIKSALIVPKKRKKTKQSRSAIEKRLNTKKKSALKKANRKKPSLE
ncbi:MULTISPECIES: alternative ribosome rescue aminoacyl-tRNA hydrolase ArfB [unclassified Cellulophaga]|uniref:alternative ribosome rescue aminoacyl-tRNA hydrolase ArfB n=1 Tax=unclassified Cellulophaga TaxID=2634405 RepID=UPI0026E2436B|nr:MULTISPECIES: alternative ribosome rescue aminoacyl-tRNA hydrolase ArfB [unclassified Cellulophaga]MDO6491225.1 alternative ribosome rescue aminoacyl-tRNA hydrolase ArfB [Cellulophaga sp. 2_MG-2023]MDO6495242.1 alternative ribosome rescue aminoacyl-tRNA hydrolase ArfB [Cellulophaga sp. 3_MG-2023]